MISIRRRYTFEAAHWLPNVPFGHKCSRMHGHSYRVEVIVGGPLEATYGWVLDFAEVDAAWAPLMRQLDHGVLNEVPGLANPTAEHLAAWIGAMLDLPSTVRVEEVTVWETARGAATWRPSGA